MIIKMPVGAWASLAVAGLFAVGVIDAVTSVELNLLPCYFIPVALGAWVLPFAAAVALAVFGASVSFIAGCLGDHAYSCLFYGVWNAGVRLISLLVLTWCLAKIRDSLESTRKLLKQALSDIKVLESLSPVCLWKRGTVNPGAEHIELIYNDQCIARVATPADNTFVVEFLLDASQSAHASIVKWAESQLDHYLVEEKDLDPWEHAKSRCSPESNGHSSLKWMYYPAGRTGTDSTHS